MRYELLDQFYNSPEYFDWLKTRVAALQAMDGDPILRTRELEHLYSKSSVAFIEQFGWIKIMEYNNATKPFTLFPYQKEVLLKLEQCENDNQEHEVLIDKIRAMGLTWIVVWYMLWRWLFYPGWSAFIMSRTETEVDDGTANPDNSIFGKIRWCIAKLPLWLKPEGYKPKKTKGTITDSTLRISNPAKGSSLNGSSTNSSAGRSRRYSFIFMDEAFFVENFGIVYTALQSVSNMKVFVSTSKAGFAYKNLQELCKKNGDYITLDWRRNPFKDQIWFDQQMAKSAVDDSVMKEIEVSYTVNPKTQYYPEVRDSKVAPVEYNEKLPLYMPIDVGKNDLTVLGYIQYDGVNINILTAYHNKNKPMEWYLPFMNWSLFVSTKDQPVPPMTMNPAWYNEAQMKFFNHICRWNKPKCYFGETAHKQRVMPLNISVLQHLASFGPPGNKIRLIINDKAATYEPRRKVTAMLLPKMVFNSNDNGAMRMYDAICNSQYANAVHATSESSVKKPIHSDEIADYRSALENFSVNFHRTLLVAQHDPDTAQPRQQVSQYAQLVKYLGRK